MAVVRKEQHFTKLSYNLFVFIHQKREKGEPACLQNAPLSSVKTREIHRNESMNMSFNVPHSPKQSTLNKTTSSRKNLVNNQSEDSTVDAKGSAVTFELGENVSIAISIVLNAYLRTTCEQIKFMDVLVM